MAVRLAAYPFLKLSHNFISRPVAGNPKQVNSGVFSRCLLPSIIPIGSEKLLAAIDI
jgi:hypothetical protein